MLKVTKTGVSVRRYTTKRTGISVQVRSLATTAKDPEGVFEVRFSRRLTTDVMDGKRRIPQFAQTVREGRSLVTYLNISPLAAVALHGLLDQIIEDAEIIKVPEK